MKRRVRVWPTTVFPSSMQRPATTLRGVNGSKTTVGDLAWLRRQGLDRAILARRAAGVPVIGICGGFQMLGEAILDESGIESKEKRVEGLGLLPVSTRFEGVKETHQVAGRVVADRGILAGCAGLPLKGYEIHMGRTTPQESGGPFHIQRRSEQPVDALDGALDAEGLTLGTYVHGLFHNDALRRRLLENVARRKGVTLPPSAFVVDADKEFDKLADFLREHIDVGAIRRMAGLEEPGS